MSVQRLVASGVCHVPGICSSPLPGKGSSASGAGNIPLAQFSRQVSLLELCLGFHSIMAGQFISTGGAPPPPASISEPASASHKQDFVVSVFKHASRQQRPRTSLTKHRHQASHGPEFHARSCLLRASRITRAPRPVSTRRPRCALSRLPGGGGCDGGSGGVSGSGRTCDLAGLQSGVGCPGPSPHHGCLHPPQLTRGHCCMEGSHCLPADSWCCTHGRFRFLSGPSSAVSFQDCVHVAP